MSQVSALAVRLWLAVFWLGLSAVGWAHEVPSDLLVRRWQSEDGLPGNIVRSIGQTADGYLWVATPEGLVRFDGISFEEVVPSGEWQGRSIDYLRMFAPGDGSLWLTTSREGVFRYADGKLVCVIVDSDGAGKADARYITSVFVHGNETFFVRDGGLFSVANGQATKVEVPTPELSREVAAALKAQRARGRDAGAPPNLPWYPSTGTRADGVGGGRNRVSAYRLTDRDGGVWRLSGRELSYVRKGSSKSAPLTHRFEEPLVVSDMLEDREGNLWLATLSEGVVQVRKRRVHQFRTPEGRYTTPVHTALHDRTGCWWIAQRNGYVDRIRNGTVTHHKIASQDNVRPVSCIFEDSSGRVWCGLRDGSLMMWDEEAGDFVAPFSRVPEVSKIRDIVEDGGGKLWFGGRWGLFRWDGSELEDFREDETIKDESFATLRLGKDGTLFAGTTTGRVFSYDGSAFSLVGDFSEHPRNWISDIVPVSPDEIWVATIGAGLFVRKDGEWHRFSADEGLPDERLTALTLLENGSFWAGSLGGILSASREELLDSLEEKGRRPHWIKLGRADGLSPRECIGSVQPGVIRDSDGTLWFPTMGGLAGVDPGSIPSESQPPILHMRSAMVNGVPHPIEAGPIKAGPGNVRLGFSFVGISLSAPESVEYRTLLKGIDGQLPSIGKEPGVVYRTVPPGHYVFEVSAVSGDGAVTAEAIRIPVEIVPHLWQRGWFKAGVAFSAIAIAIAIGWLFARARMRRKFREFRLREALQSERSRISRDLHDDLGASLTELSILSALAAEEHSVDSGQPALDQLSVKAKLVVRTLDEIVWATSPGKDTLKSLVEYLAFFTSEFLKTVGLPLKKNIQHSIPDMEIGPRRRHAVLLATREAVNNSVKHSGANGIELDVSVTGGRLLVVIRDDGSGFEPECVARGNGLTNIRRRMDECGGACEIETAIHQGTKITLTLPLPS